MRWGVACGLAVWGGLVGWGGLSLAGCDDDGDPRYTPPTGADNGARCILSPAGAAGCRGTECVGFFGAQIGQCTERCTASCRFGGACVKFEDSTERYCLPRCASGAECSDGFACQPVDGLLECDADGCNPPERNGFCVPLTN